MREISHDDLMRAILYHRLDATVDTAVVHAPYNGVRREWKLPDRYSRKLVAREDVPDAFHNDDGTVARFTRTECSDEFHEKYIATLPADAVRCRSCKAFGRCGIQRADIDRHCNEWTQN